MVYTFCEKYIDPKRGVKAFENFADKFRNNVVTISGPHITQVNGADRLTDYFVSGSIIVEVK